MRCVSKHLKRLTEIGVLGSLMELSNSNILNLKCLITKMFKILKLLLLNSTVQYLIGESMGW